MSLQDEIVDLRKARKFTEQQIQSVVLKQEKLEKDTAREKTVNDLVRDVDRIAHEQKQLRSLESNVQSLQKESVRKKEYQQKYNDLKKQFASLKKQLLHLKRSGDKVTEERVARIEQNILSMPDIKKEVLADVEASYVSLREIKEVIDPLQKEYSKLYDKVGTIKRDVLDFQRSRFVANLLLLLSLIHYLGASSAIALSYLSAANFLAIEGSVLLVVGVVIKLIIGMMR